MGWGGGVSNLLGAGENAGGELGRPGSRYGGERRRPDLRDAQPFGRVLGLLVLPDENPERRVGRFLLSLLFAVRRDGREPAAAHFRLEDEPAGTESGGSHLGWLGC